MSNGIRCPIWKLAGLLVLAVTTACAADTKKAAASPADERAVLCAKCQTVWIERPDVTDVYLLTYRPEQAMRCPDCIGSVRNFFRTGRLEHACSSCDGVLVSCASHVD